MSKYYGKKLAPKPKASFSWVLLAAVGAVALIIVGVASLAGPRQAPTAAPPGTTTAGAGPQVAVDHIVLDFGKVVMDTPVTAAFKVKNVGSEPLQILGQPQVRVVEGC